MKVTTNTAASTDSPQLDAVLVAGLRARQATATEELVARFSGRIYRVVLPILGNPADAEEVVQDVLLRVVNQIHRFRQESRLSTWIHRIATNLALGRRRARPKHVPVPWDEEGLRALPLDASRPVIGAAQGTPPGEATEQKQFLSRLEAALSRLPVESRAAVLLRDWHGLPAEVAARTLGVSIEAFKSRLHRARVFLREQLVDFTPDITARTA